jgi:hypothetical protein
MVRKKFRHTTWLHIKQLENLKQKNRNIFNSKNLNKLYADIE